MFKPFSNQGETMGAKDQQIFLKNEINNLIDHYKTDRQRHKLLALALKAMSVSLSGTITVLLGLKVSSGTTSVLFSNIALVLGAMTTVVGAYEAFFDPRVLWVRETVVFARLKDLERDLDFAENGSSDGELDSATLECFKVRLDSILNESLNAWLQLRGQNTKEPSPDSTDNKTV
jgi:hypothetical protein